MNKAASSWQSFTLNKEYSIIIHNFSQTNAQHKKYFHMGALQTPSATDTIYIYVSMQLFKCDWIYENRP